MSSNSYERKNYICNLIIVFFTFAACSTYVFNSVMSYINYTEVKKQNDFNSSSDIFIPSFMLAGTIFKKEGVVGSMKMDPLKSSVKFLESDKYPVNRICIYNLGNYNAINVSMDIKIDEECVDYVKNFLLKNNIKIELFFKDVERKFGNGKSYLEYITEYSYGSDVKFSRVDHTITLPIILKNEFEKPFIPRRLELFIKLVAHLKFFYKETFEIERISNSPIKIIIHEFDYNKKRNTQITAYMLYLMFLDIDTKNPTYFANIATSSDNKEK